MLLVAEKSQGKGFGVNGCDLSSIQPLCWTTKEGGGGLLVVSSGDTKQEVTDRLSLSDLVTTNEPSEPPGHFDSATARFSSCLLI